MRYVSFREDGQHRIGVVMTDGVLDLTGAAAALGISIPGSMEKLIAAGPAGRQKTEAVVEQALDSGKGQLLAEDDLDYLPVVSAPEKIVCVGLNYRRHAEESGMPVPAVPVYFPKYANSLIGHGKDVVLPKEAKENDYEVELAVIIGKTIKRAAVEEALDAVFGYTVGNDLSARDLQMRSSQWLYGKAIDGFLPLGPWLVTADEVEDPQALRLRCSVNGELRQNSSTSDMVFTVAEIISDLSHVMTLRPGDVILTGTPEGVAMGMESKPWLQPGDVVECEIDGLGKLVNRMAAEEN